MTFSRQALRYELEHASAGTLLRLWLRCLLLWFLVWAVSDVIIVWLWSGHLAGPGAHQYFGRWVLAWLFTQELPLGFLSLPYHSASSTRARTSRAPESSPPSPTPPFVHVSAAGRRPRSVERARLVGASRGG